MAALGRRPGILGLVAILVALPACGAGAASPGGNEEAVLQGRKEITVAAAASLTDVLKLAAEDYSRRAPQTTVYLSFGASSTIARQIRAGAPVDLFFSADKRQMELLETSGLIRAGSRANLLRNRLAFVVSGNRWQKGQTVEQIVSDPEARFALCDASVPIGNYAKQYLEARGWYDKLATKSVKLDNARALVAAVDSGNADLALIFETDAAAAKTARIIRVIPENEGPEIVYQVAMVGTTASPEESRAFIDYLRLPPALEIFKIGGFITINETTRVHRIE